MNFILNKQDLFMEQRKLILILTIAFLSFQNANAQTLTPANTTFQILPIIVREGIYLSGNSSYIAAYVQAYYPDLAYRKIGMDCYLNGDEFNATQNCSVQFYPEKGVCSILFPQYPSLVIKNEVKCKIYDPEYPEITSMYVNKSFTPLNFETWFSNYSSLVGEEFNFPVNLENFGLFTDIYNLTAWVNDPNKVRINPATSSFLVELHGDAFDPHAWNQTGPEIKQVYIKLTILDASSEPYVCVNVTSSINTSFSKQSCVGLKAKLRISI